MNIYLNLSKEERLDKACEILKNTSAELSDLVGVECTILLLDQVVKTLNKNLEYIKTGENKK